MLSTEAKALVVFLLLVFLWVSARTIWWGFQGVRDFIRRREVKRQLKLMRREDRTMLTWKRSRRQRAMKRPRSRRRRDRNG